jgi:hypothetical protein
MAKQIPADAISSNQPPAMKCGHSADEASSAIVGGPFCDRITLVARLSVADVAPYAAIEGMPPDQFLHAIAFKVVTAIKKSTGLGYMPLRKKIPKYDAGQKGFGPNGAMFCVGVSRPSKLDPHSRLFRFEFNPSAFQVPGLKWIENEVEGLVCDTLPFDLFLARATISGLHVAYDVLGVPITDLLFRVRRGAKSLNPNSKAAGKWSSYFSSASKIESVSQFAAGPRGRALFTAYDKLQERIDAGSETDCSMPWVRLERKLSNPKVMFADLPQLPNPFSTLSILRLSEAAHGLGGHWLLFADSTLRRGLAGALELVPADLRAQYESAFVNALDATFWDGAGLWENWSSGMEQQGLLSWAHRAAHHKVAPNIGCKPLQHALAQTLT